MVDKKLPPDQADAWPGILDEIDIKVVPVEYIDSVEVQFTDGKVWAIELDKQEGVESEEAAAELEESLDSLFEEYEEVIVGIHFVLDIEKVKEDITARTKTFMRKKK